MPYVETQVEAALTNDPENEELLKLKADLTVSVEQRMLIMHSCYVV